MLPERTLEHAEKASRHVSVNDNYIREGEMPSLLPQAS